MADTQFLTVGSLRQLLARVPDSATVTLPGSLTFSHVEILGPDGVAIRVIEQQDHSAKRSAKSLEAVFLKAPSRDRPRDRFGQVIYGLGNANGAITSQF